MVRIVALDSIHQFAAINLTADPGYDRGNRVIPGCAEIIITWGQEDGVFANNVLHGSYSGPFAGSQTQANSIMSGLTTGASWTAFATFLASTTFVAGVSVRNLALASQPKIESALPGVPGASSAEALPNEVALVATERTGGAGPQNRGRIYLPGFGANALSPGNVVLPAALAAAQTWASTIAGVLSASGYVLGIAHFSRLAYTGVGGTQHPARAAGIVPVTSVAMRDNHWDTQRRRGLK